MKIYQPKIGRLLLKKFARIENEHAVMGDFEEEYNAIYEEKGIVIAWMWYWIQVLKSFPSFLINQIIWSKAMFKNYLKTAFRIIKKTKIISFINLLSLSIGMAVSILVFLYINNEINHDTFHKDHEKIFRIWSESYTPGGNIYLNSAMPIRLADDLKEHFPEIESITRISSLEGHVNINNNIFKNLIFFCDRELRKAY